MQEHRKILSHQGKGRETITTNQYKITESSKKGVDESLNKGPRMRDTKQEKR